MTANGRPGAAAPPEMVHDRLGAAGAPWDMVHDGRLTFRACVRAICEPGALVEAAPRAGWVADPALDRATAVLLALLDPGVGLAAAGEAARTVARRLTAVTGAAPAPVADAEFVLLGADAPAGMAAQARRGNALHPERGATIVCACDGRHTRVVAAGPGLPAARRLDLPVDRDGVAALIAAGAAPPAGVDAFLATARGLVALPRSTRLELG
jgi:phosphonate C-P lyase system protein PhnH